MCDNLILENILNKVHIKTLSCFEFITLFIGMLNSIVTFLFVPLASCENVNVGWDLA